MKPSPTDPRPQITHSLKRSRVFYIGHFVGRRYGFIRSLDKITQSIVWVSLGERGTGLETCLEGASVAV